jgi:RimJ/RimL family protein N-acetyltransferase
MPALIRVPAGGTRAELLIRPWRETEMAELIADMSRDYPARGLFSNPDLDRPGRETWTGPRSAAEAESWLAGQHRGWRAGDWLTFAVLECSGGPGESLLAGHLALQAARPGLQVGQGGPAEIGYWTVSAARGRGIATAAVRAVTQWAFDHLGPAGLTELKLVHDVVNQASCRVAEKSEYPCREFSPASPPLWFTDGHIHCRTSGYG